MYKRIIILLLCGFLVSCSMKPPKAYEGKVLCSYKDSTYDEILLLDYNTDDQIKDISNYHIVIRKDNSSDSIPVTFVNPEFLKNFVKKCK